jgi:hypothetical protein
MLSYCFPFASRLILGLLALGVFGLAANPAAAQMKTGEAMQAFEEVFDVELSQRGYPFEANLVECDVPGKILWPGEQPRLTFAIRNNLDRVINTQGRIHVIRYGTKGIAGNIWLPELVRFEDVAGKSIEVDLEAGETTRIDYHPELPGTFGGYAFIVELAGHGRRVAATLARSVQVETEPQQYPAFSLDIKDPTILRRLGVQAIRMGSSYIRSDRDDYEQ